MKRSYLSAAIALACAMGSSVAMAQTSTDQATGTTAQPAPRAGVSSTSNSTTSNDTKRVQELSAVQVKAQSLSLGSGLMAVQTAPKAVSTITRDAIVHAAPGATFVQLIDSIPGVNASTDDNNGLANGNYSIRGFTSDEIGTTVNGAPINDSGNYKVYSTEYGDTENIGDITVLQGYPDVDTPISGAAGGSIAWVTIDPPHKAGIDVTQSFGSNDLRRSFIRINTGDTGAFRSWLSYSNNQANLWRGPGSQDADKVDGKTIWTIDDNNTISGSVQYVRQDSYLYQSLTKKQLATGGYNQSYDLTRLTPTDANFYAFHKNPFKSWLVSLDGEFKLSDSLRLSVVPYVQYGNGGSGGGATFTESTQPDNFYQYSNQDLNGDGVIGGKNNKALTYSYNSSYTMRPGVIAKFNQDFGQDNSLEYGAWYERPRQEQTTVYTPINAAGIPADYLGRDSVILYPDGSVQRQFNEYTTTETRKVFATDTWTPNDFWTFTAGTSFLSEKRTGFDFQYPGSVGPTASKKGYGVDDVSATYHKWSPTIGAKYQLNEQNQFYFGVGKTFRAPINGAFLQNAAASRESAQPETATTADLGWRFYNDTFSANVDAYFSNLNNKQISGFDEATSSTIYLALPKVHNRGINTEASYKITPNWTLYASYAYQKSILETNLDSSGDGIFNTKGKDLLNTPRNLGYLRVSYDQGPFWASLDEKVRSSIYGDWSNTERAGGYATLNLSAGWRFNDFSSFIKKPYIKLNMFNLTDREALTNANNIGAFLASNPGKIKDANGVTLFASAPYYSLLQGRSFQVTFGASF